MNPKKQKTKDRRRARKLAEQAWEAVDAGNLDLAEMIVRRAVAAQTDNPVLWVDQGLILGLRGKEAASADAFCVVPGLRDRGRGEERDEGVRKRDEERDEG
ncbi:MAG TPA: hypothetical protein VL371_18835 [Gemmataceae bacterium]|nr:hypothetical protein [Gemmataceae bacterium]